MLRIPQIHFFPLLPWLPKQPKQKNSCSKMWPIDQLCTELGFWACWKKNWAGYEQLLKAVFFRVFMGNFFIYLRITLRILSFFLRRPLVRYPDSVTAEGEGLSACCSWSPPWMNLIFIYVFILSDAGGGDGASQSDHSGQPLVRRYSYFL